MTDNLPVKTSPPRQPPDSLEELSNLLTDKLIRWDCFDFDVTVERLNAFKKIIVARGLEWVYAMDDPTPWRGIVTLVVGVPGTDFEEHENLR